MAVTITSVLASVVCVAALRWAWGVLNWVWFRPTRVERCLRQQGFAGKPYRFLVGDWKENTDMLKETRTKPIGLSDAILPRVMPFLHQLVKDYGKNSFMWIGSKPRVNIMNPDQIRDVFMKINEYQKPSHPQLKLLTCGLVSHEGEKWAKHRKIINPAFHQERLKLMIPAFYESCSEMINKWEKVVSVDDRPCELDVWPYLQSLSCDAISRTSFGSNYKEGKRIFDLIKKQTDLTFHVILRAIIIPGYRFLPIQSNRRLKAIDKEIKASLKALINKREKAMSAGEDTKNDLLDLLLESNLSEIKAHGNTKSVGMSSEDVVEECKIFYFAGQETTSVLLTWTMILLAQYPDWQARAREEVAQVFGNKKPDFDGLNHLKVVTMILYEVLRLYPPVTLVNRDVHEEIKLGNLLLPAGVQVSVPAILLHQDPELWGDDASEFKPERFAEGVSKATKSQFSFLPFGGGPRICIGQNFALIEAKMALAMVLRHYSFELSPSYIHAPITVVTLQPQHGAPMILLTITSVLASIVCVAVLRWAWGVLNWVWFRPKRVERCLRQQGFAGKPYRVLVGDWKESSDMLQEARTKPIGLSDAILPRVMPFLHQLVKDYGKNSFMWIGPKPRVNIMNPDQIRDIFMKTNEYQKPTHPQLKPLACGLASHEGEKWAKHRKIINPAFHQEKLKLMIPALYESCSEMINKWEKVVSVDDRPCELDVWPYLQSLSCDAISRTSFGSNYKEGKRIFDLIKELTDLIYPEWQEHAREEVVQVFGNRKPDFDGLNHLKVVTMILYEVLRLYPPVILLNRDVHEEIKLGNVLLPAGVQVAVPTILLHQDPKLWGDDASEFKPERFAEGVSKATKSQVSFLPFGWGPRICIGQNFALIEAKMALAMILRHYSFELSPSYIHAPRTIITLQPQHGAPMILRKL
uniref:Cytochrome P450 n=1 Tax=Salix viminalis TaxID=40686 RepID=A0A6N2KLN2_SALVM